MPSRMTRQISLTPQTVSWKSKFLRFFLWSYKISLISKAAFSKNFLTLRRPTCQSWHKKIFFKNCYVKTMKKYPLHFNRADFMKIMSVPQDHCRSHNYFFKIFSKNYTLYGVYIFSNFGFCLNRLALKDTKTHFYISEVVQS